MTQKTFWKKQGLLGTFTSIAQLGWERLALPSKARQVPYSVNDPSLIFSLYFSYKQTSILPCTLDGLQSLLVPQSLDMELVPRGSSMFQTMRTSFPAATTLTLMMWSSVHTVRHSLWKQRCWFQNGAHFMWGRYMFCLHINIAS